MPRRAKTECRMGEVKAKKSLGQHFLVDLNIARKICDALTCGDGAAPRPVLEVGCGMGVLTQFLLQRPDIETWGAEIDSESVAYLQEHFPAFTPRLIAGDFLQLDLRTHFPDGLRVIGNFPYNISSQIFFKVTLLQVIKRIVPPMGNEIITLVKDTSLVRVISVYEVMWNGQAFIKSSGLIWPLFFTAVYYLAFNGLLTILFGWLEKKLDYFKV